MQIIEDPKTIQEKAAKLRQAGKTLALVPTSGALNPGHQALVAKAREVADVVVLCAFVNPREFGPNEDYQLYPRNSSGDAEFCKENKVDILFRPLADDVYPSDFSISVSESTLSATLCGISRPHYFRGVCTWHAILLVLIRPDHLIQGRRDAQKCAVLKKLVREMQFPIETHVVDVVRDEAGLVYNARNTYLNEFQRKDASTINKALLEGKKLVDIGITNVDRIMAEVTHHLSLVRRLRLIYVAAVNPETMEPLRSQIAPGKTLVMTAVWCDEVRLIDNILI